jgi:CMP-N,N'-diacetyllegionaminic acid synthase
MYKGKRVLGLIPARGGSKRLPGKNTRLLAGKPLIAWSIEQGLRSGTIDRLIVNTDDPEIANLARRCGADVPFMRPPHLAEDTSPVTAAILHAMHTLSAAGDRFDVVVLLECTSPVRYPGDIDGLVATLVESDGAGSAVGVVPLTHEHPAWTFRIADGRLEGFFTAAPTAETSQRQALEDAYLPYSIYASWWDTFERYRLFYQPKTVPYVLKREQMVEVDDEVDLLIAETLMRHFMVPVWSQPTGA